MEEMKFKSLQRGDSVFTLERDRRSMYPIFDRAKVVKVGESKPRANENGDGFSNLIEIVLQNSIGTVTVYLPSDGNEGIYNNVYYTLIGSNIINEVSLQRYKRSIIAKIDHRLSELLIMWVNTRT